MSSASAPPGAALRLPPRAVAVLRCLASLQLAVSLLVLMGGVLAAATIVETYEGAEAARWYVYEAPWFKGLFILLGVNIAGAAIIRFPWQRHQTGFVVTHVGLLLLLGGAALTACWSTHGEITLREGERSSELTIGRRSRIAAFHVGRPDEAPYEFSFIPRPYDWDAAATMDLSAVDGVAVRIREWIRNPRLQTDWIADEEHIGGPAVRFKITDAAGRHVAEAWLVDQQFGEPGEIGPLRMQLERAASPAMLADFRSPLPVDLGEQGLLLAYYGDEVLRVPVQDNIGRSMPIGTTAASLEIVSYLANARPDRLGQFTSVDDRPRNPMLELRIHLPDVAEPQRQVAFARDPYLNLDGVYGRICPVAIRYYHPAVRATATVALMQTDDGRLYGRTLQDSGAVPLEELAPGDAIDVPGGFRLELLQHLRHARRQISFKPAPHSMRQAPSADAEPAAFFELTVGAEVQQVWMRRNDPVYGRRILPASSGQLAVQFEPAREPLGFALELVDFVREPNPGNAGDAAFSSRVRIIDEPYGVDREQVISMNEPLTYAGRTFYQANFDDAAHGRESSTLAVTVDAGRALKYAGGLLVCAGIAIMFYMRAYFFRPLPPVVRPSAVPTGFADTEGVRLDAGHECAVTANAASKPSSVVLAVRVEPHAHRTSSYEV